MSDLTPIRRSGRQRVPNRKYVETENAFLDMDNILAENDVEAEREGLRTDFSPEEDLEFSAEPMTQDLDQESIESNFISNVSEGSGIATPPEDHESSRSYENESFRVNRKSLLRTPNESAASHHGSRSRGVPEQQTKNLQDRINILAGPDKNEIAALRKSRAQWGNDFCLPRSESMLHAFAHTEEQRIMEAQKGWDWYFNQGGIEAFAENQSMTILPLDARTRYLAGSSQHVLMGPYGNQKLFDLLHLQTLPIDGFPCGSPEDAVEEVDPNQRSDRKRKRHGWMLNIGNKVQCLDWAPNHDSGIQYLALASSQSLDHPLKEQPQTAPAFTPSPSTPANIQIWAFPIIDSLETDPFPDRDTAPKLVQVLCNDWGDAKQLKWCPMPRGELARNGTGRTIVGLLAGIWGDGYARVLDVQLHDPMENREIYMTVSSAAFAARPINIICTCVCWLSPTDIAIGHSDGSTAIYDIHPTSNEKTAKSTIPAAAGGADTAPSPSCPYISIPDPRSTFSPVLTLSSAYPTHPTLLATSSISGYERLLDLRAPMTDYVLGPRTRSPSTNLVYSPHLLSFVYNDESDSTIRATGLRCWGVDHVRFAKSYRGGKDEGNSAGPLGRGCLDIGKVHSSVAWGTADGSVLVSNPVSAVLGLRRAKTENGQVCVCRLEWVRNWVPSSVDASSSRPDGQESAGTDVDEELVDAGEQDTRPRGISRITQSYKAEKPDFVRGRSDKHTYATIYEEENSVTAVSWNPNLRCGGWLAVGWGCGLVRVENVAI